MVRVLASRAVPAVKFSSVVTASDVESGAAVPDRLTGQQCSAYRSMAAAAGCICSSNVRLEQFMH